MDHAKQVQENIERVEKEHQALLLLEKVKLDERLKRLEINSELSIQKLTYIVENVTNLNIKVGIQNGRVYKLENWKSYLMGGTSMLAILFSVLAFIVTVFKK